ncbi:unnamed protein product [Arabidopsis thaliana]|uniref:(thale cress) hypothetical protein n=1 Tax=Arabidopsis thaliana TaxID=3702 RepID=A0A7G2DQB2_ARATH|nr:unnamed protein product [Arabidopsis thaliana]
MFDLNQPEIKLTISLSITTVANLLAFGTNLKNLQTLGTGTDLYNSVGWTLAAPRTGLACDLLIYLSTIALPTDSDELDAYDWVVEDKLCNGFSSAKTWEFSYQGRMWLAGQAQCGLKVQFPNMSLHMWATNLDLRICVLYLTANAKCNFIWSPFSLWAQRDGGTAWKIMSELSSTNGQRTIT